MFPNRKCTVDRVRVFYFLKTRESRAKASFTNNLYIMSKKRFRLNEPHS